MRCEDLVEALRADPLLGWVCQPQDDFLRLQSPMRYSDGGTIELFVEIRAGGYVVTDLGEAYRFLDSGGIDVTRSATKRRITELAAELGRATENEGSFEILVDSIAKIIPAAIRLGQVVSRVGDIMLMNKSSLGGAFSDRIADYLRESTTGVEIKRHSTLEGHAQAWRVDILARSMNRVAAIEGLSAITPNGANAQTAFTVQKFYDLSFVPGSPERFSVLDDEEDVWSASLRQQLAHVSEVVEWERRDLLVSYLSS